MLMYKIINICEKPELKKTAANWFHNKWDIPVEAYEESIESALKNDNNIPAWYVCLDKNEIIAGVGVIENDFHNRKDLTPNICALYVEEKYRCQKIAGRLLEFVYNDMKEKGIDTLYLITEHTSFYEKYGLQFLCMVKSDENDEMMRMYIYKK